MTRNIFLVGEAIINKWLCFDKKKKRKGKTGTQRKEKVKAFYFSILFFIWKLFFFEKNQRIFSDGVDVFTGNDDSSAIYVYLP